MIYLIDPWASSSVDYDKLVNQFGIQKFSDLIDDVENPHRLMKRGVIFGHRDFDKVNNLINKKEDFAVVGGMMPSGQMHIGHKMVVDQLKWYQDKGAMLSILIADLESYAARDMSFEKARDIAVNEYLTNYIALGLNLEEDNVNVYLQSKNDTLRDLAFKASKKTNFNELKELLQITDGNLASHLKALEENDMIKIKKGFIGRKTNTTYSLTKNGEKSFKAHIEALEKMIKFSR